MPRVACGARTGKPRRGPRLEHPGRHPHPHPHRNQLLQFGTAAVITLSGKGGVGAVPFRQTELLT
ncbi:hypothetical protein [Streptomyces echinatus]|uniref:hypothetical protein n=1 Tax=Streptomyces echinatus TaxID=67293 RepID=UPI003807CC59